MPVNANAPIVVEQTFEVPVAAVWKAITDKDAMPLWFFEQIADFEPRVGFEAQFTVTVDDLDFVHLWKVVDVVAEQRIAYQWRYEGYPGDSTVTWELFQTPDGTRLQLTHTVHEPFPQNIDALKRESGLTGWQYLIQESLKAYLDRQR